MRRTQKPPAIDPDALYECVEPHLSEFGLQQTGRQLLGRDLAVASQPGFWALAGDSEDREAKLRALTEELNATIAQPEAEEQLVPEGTVVALESLTTFVPNEDPDGPPVARQVHARQLVSEDDPVVKANPENFARA